MDKNNKTTPTVQPQVKESRLGVTPQSTAPHQERKIFTIHVYPHVKKFMNHKYAHSNGIFRAEEYSVVGKLVTYAIIDKRGWRSHNDQVRDRLTASIRIELTKDQLTRGPRGASLQRLNIDLDGLFKDALMQWIEAQNSSGIPVHAACKNFLEHYNLDETDYSLDSAYKYWQRHNKK